MTTFTPKYGFPIPEMSDAPDGVPQLTDLALAVESTVANDVAQTWTPAWDSIGNPKPTNPATIGGRYTLLSGWCDFSFRMSMSGLTTGGAGQWRFTLPFVANSQVAETLVYGKLLEPQVANFPLHGVIYGGSNQLWCFTPQGPQMWFTALQQRNATNTPGTHFPTNNPGPIQSGGSVAYTGRYLVA